MRLCGYRQKNFKKISKKCLTLSWRHDMIQSQGTTSHTKINHKTEGENMKILFANSFYSDFTLYETNNPEDLKTTIKKLVNGEAANIDEAQHKLIGSSEENLETDEAINQADETIFIFDLYEN